MSQTFEGPFIFTQHNKQTYNVLSYRETNETYYCQIPSPVKKTEVVSFEISVNDIKDIAPDWEQPAPKKIGMQFKTFGAAMEAVKKERDDIYRTFRKGQQRGDKDLIRFHYHGLIAMVDGERYDRVDTSDISLRSLKETIAYLEREKPNSKFSIDIEGHFDWFESHEDMFAGTYEPSDLYVNVTIYSNY